ncbi:MAG: peptidylprolyl isomerase [Polyangiaceae bacterium]|jgi:peptidyl-prolyl cis-trans isomerase A (cyclophilin A)|nr:peptidylprolyl isomerase [Polyangiaceae bacterium]
MRARNWTFLLAAALLAAASTGCEAKKPDSAPASATATVAAPTKAAEAPPPKPAAVPDKPIPEALLAPEKAKEKAPDKFKAKFTTTQGDFVIEVTRAWAPNGADRFYNLLKLGYFEDIAVFRVVDGFMAQFGIHGSPKVNAAWREASIPDDPRKESNTRGYVTYAMRGPNTRTVQLFINFADNSRLDSQGFSPFGKVVEGMDIVDKLYKGYGEGAPTGAGPDQGRLQMQGNAYLRDEFPKLDYIKSAQIVK